MLHLLRWHLSHVEPCMYRYVFCDKACSMLSDSSGNKWGVIKKSHNIICIFLHNSHGWLELKKRVDGFMWLLIHSYIFKSIWWISMYLFSLPVITHHMSTLKYSHKQCKHVEKLKEKNCQNNFAKWVAKLTQLNLN